MVSAVYADSNGIWLLFQAMFPRKVSPLLASRRKHRVNFFLKVIVTSSFPVLMNLTWFHFCHNLYTVIFCWQVR
jgi:hypothetical protein